MCPAGFDCINANSCPSFVVDCPTGYFCSTLDHQEHQTILEKKYADWKGRYGETPVTSKNYKSFLEPGNYVSTNCFSGFYCPNASTIISCDEGNWCPETLSSPLACDGLSVCEKMQGFQVNFVLPLIAVVATCLLFMISIYMTRKQMMQQMLSQQKEMIANKRDEQSIPEERQVWTGDGIMIEFNDVCLAIPGANAEQSYENMILKRVSGTIPARTLCGIMGPTSCGKTSLLEVLKLGRHKKNCVAGSVNITFTNSQKCLSESELKSCLAFVPQKEILDRSLTIRELLYFQMSLRRWEMFSDTKFDVDLAIQKVIDEMFITKIADTIIGGSETTPANISGGQLKRVNIACELVALSRPAVLFLDEPTSGLDANIACELIQLLRKMTTDGVTSLVAIQQPRPEIFELFHRIILMLDGYIVYEGSPSDVTAYLSSMGYNCPITTSPADFCVDVLNSIVDPMIESICSTPEDLIKAWTVSDSKTCSRLSDAIRNNEDGIELGSSQIKIHPAEATVATPSLGQMTAQDTYDTSNYFISKDAAKRFYIQMQISIKRQFIIAMRNRSNLYLYAILQISGAIFLSVAFSVFLQETYANTFELPTLIQFQNFLPSTLLSHTNNNNDLGFKQLLFFLPAIVGSMSSLCAVPLFSGRRDVLTREAKSGVSPVATSTGFIVFDLIFVLWNSLLFSAAWVLFGHPGHWWNWLGVIFFTSYASSGIGYLIAALTTPISANTATVVLSLICAVFSGVEPTLRQVNKLAILCVPWYISFATWTAEGTYYTWTTYLADADMSNEERIQEGADKFGYDLGSMNRAVGCLIALGTAFRIFTVCAVVYTTSK
jgi:ABC-type multidrug transport system ATPase subunit